MALLFCENHIDLRWYCKDMAISNGRYNGARNIFFFGKATKDKPNGEMIDEDNFIVRECDCPSSKLKAIEGTYEKDVD